MRYLGMTLCTATLVSLVGANCFATAPADELRDVVKKAQVAKSAMGNFLERYGVEVVREKNMEQKGQIEGQINGSMHMGMLGNVPKLVEGLIGIPSLFAGVINPFAPMALGLSPITSILTGLSGMGYGSGSINGSISGSFDGTGVKINDEAHLFLLVGKRTSSFADVVQAYRGRAGDSEYVRNGDDVIDTLMKIYNDPYILTEEEISSFMTLRSEFRAAVQRADEILSDQIGSKDPLYTAAQDRIEIMKSWAAKLRTVIAIAAPKPLEVVQVDVKVVCNDPVKLTGLNSLRIYVNGGTGTIEPGFCVTLPDQGDWNKELRDKVTLRYKDHFWSEIWSYADPVPTMYIKEKKRSLTVPAVEDGVLQKLFNPDNLETKEERLFF